VTQATQAVRNAGLAAAVWGARVGATTKAAVFVTVDLEDLQTRCGAGSTLSGQLLAR
jgi:hypothetical protein